MSAGTKLREEALGMIWDRWEDAMDDLDDEKRDLRSEIADLEDQLRDLGEPIPPDPPGGATTEYATDSSADLMHREASDRVNHLQLRRDRLAALVERARRGRS